MSEIVVMCKNKNFKDANGKYRKCKTTMNIKQDTMEVLKGDENGIISKN